MTAKMAAPRLGPKKYSPKVFSSVIIKTATRFSGVPVVQYHYVTCPACQAKLKYRSTSRTHIDCPGCHQRFPVGANSSPAQPIQKPSVPIPKDDFPELSPSPTAVKQPEAAGISNGLVVGLAIGVMVTAVLVVGVLFLLESDVPLTAEANLSTQIEHGAETDEVVVSKSESVSVDSPQAISTISKVASPQPPVVESEGVSNSIDTAPPLRFRWRVGQQFTYDFSFTAHPDSGERKITGSCSYRVAKIIPPADDSESGGYGTAFVVDADGYLVTCAHVVKDAEQIKVKLGEQEWIAEIVAYDALQDIALLRVNDTDLPTLALAENNEVELAQTVRVVGYPLAGVFGKGIKITSGSVAGMPETDDDGARQFQVDALMNPGNSGGPLVNAQGRVVGVASASISGFSISNVGLAVPVDEVRKMLERANVRPAVSSQEMPLSGPELARRVTPSVVYVEVRYTPAAYQDYQVDYSYQLQSQSFAPNSPHFRDPRFHPGINAAIIPGSGKGTFTVDRMGEISEYEGEVSLPYSHLLLGKVFLEDLASDGNSAWASTEFTTFTAEEPQLGQDVHSRLRQNIRSRFPEPHVVPSPFGAQQQETKKYSALVQTQYELADETAEKLTITKTYEYHTLDDEKPPRMTQTGTGTFVFDKQLGLSISSEFSGSSSERNINDQVTTVPYKLSYTLRNSSTPPVESNFLAELAFAIGRSTAEDTERPQRERRRRQDQRERHKPRITNDPDRVVQLVEELEAQLSGKNESNSRGRHQQFGSAASELSQLAHLSVVPDKQQQVAKIFLHFAFHGDSFEQSTSIRGLTKWAVQENVPQLIELLTTDVEGIDWPERQNLIEALGRFSSPAVYRAIASRLAHNPEDDEAQETLIAFGSPAEKAVSTMLESKSEDARDAAAEILEKIGTRKSLPALQRAVAEEPDHFTMWSMERAIKAIRSRR